MSRVIELSEEEISCLATGLHYLNMYDKEFAYVDKVPELLNKIEENRIFVGGK